MDPRGHQHPVVDQELTHSAAGLAALVRRRPGVEGPLAFVPLVPRDVRVHAILILAEELGRPLLRSEVTRRAGMNRRRVDKYLEVLIADSILEKDPIHRKVCLKM